MVQRTSNILETTLRPTSVVLHESETRSTVSFQEEKGPVSFFYDPVQMDRTNRYFDDDEKKSRREETDQNEVLCYRSLKITGALSVPLSTRRGVTGHVN